MSTAEAKTRYSADDLLTLADGDRYELVDGRLVERNMGAVSSYIGGLLYYLLQTFCRDQRSGWVLPADASYQCFPDAPDRVRKPDVSVILLGRLPGERLPRGHIRITPDLAVEVLSPNDLAYEVEQKVAEYLAAGVRLVWVINPDQQTVHVYRADGRVARLQLQDELSGEDVLDGFRCQVRELFPPVAADE